VPRARRPTPPPQPPLDSVDRLVAEWRAVRPDLDFAPVEVVTRIRRLRTHLDAALEAALAACGLSSPVFGVLSALRRQGPPFQLSQRALMERLGLTSGTVSVRVDQLVELGLVTRQTDPGDRRGSLVQLTGAGLQRCDACTPAYLADEDRLLSALSLEERSQLALLLRHLLAGFEAERRPEPSTAALGLMLVPAHVARQRQRELGLPERAGLLVRRVAPDSPAEAAGVRAGDLLVRVGSQELRSPATLAQAIANASVARTARISLGVARTAQGELELEVELARRKSEQRLAPVT
jgi:DNA-binding MarR family transcriptional regulator